MCKTCAMLPVPHTQILGSVWLRIVMTIFLIASAQHCERQLFVVHWSHVPKAGGTAMANLARRVACAQNPHLARIGDDELPIEAHHKKWLNPCCVPTLCLSEVSCFASTSTCPLVQGIGRHTTSMMMLADMACCSSEWFERTRISFYRSAWRPPPSEEDLERTGVVRVAKDKWKALSASAVGLAIRMHSYVLWPLESRLAFFASVGVGLEEIESRAQHTGLFERGFMTRDRARQIHANFSVRAGSLLGRTRQTVVDSVAICHRAAQTIHADALAGHSLPPFPSEAWRRRVAMNRSQAMLHRPCCSLTTAGANSMTLLRLPFTRLASAYFYRGHSPNSDNYKVRPGVYKPASTLHGDGAKYHYYSFKEFVEASEYRNIMTKMFGDSQGCETSRRCKRRPSCEVLAECHAYRNATLNETHVDIAFNALRQHAFVGLLEAYNASTKLAMLKFQVDPYLDGRDFAASRSSYSLVHRCSGATALRLDARACRGAFKHNRLDSLLYERVHRLFCDRLKAAGLFNQPEVRAELAARRLCGETDFSSADEVCGPLERNTSSVDYLKSVCGPKHTVRWHWGYASSTR